MGISNEQQQSDCFVKKGFQATGEAFSIATLMYARMRRVAGRMIDVMYLVENIEYARYVIQLAILMQDDELNRLVQRLEILMQKELDQSVKKETSRLEQEQTLTDHQASITKDKEYQAQISHHYVGALR